MRAQKEQRPPVERGDRKDIPDAKKEARPQRLMIWESHK